MGKTIRDDQEIFVALNMTGKLIGGEAVVIDEANNRKLDPNDIDDKILIYEQEVNGWFLTPAKELIDQSPSENLFIVLMVCMSYLEGVEQYKTGRSSNGNSQACFISSINRVYPNLFITQHIKNLYVKSRCGLFHNGMVKEGVLLSNGYGTAIKFSEDGTTIKINPSKMLHDLRHDFENYITDLKHDIGTNELRDNFDKMFSVL